MHGRFPELLKSGDALDRDVRSGSPVCVCYCDVMRTHTIYTSDMTMPPRSLHTAAHAEQSDQTEPVDWREGLVRRQQEHLRRVQERLAPPQQPCHHDMCASCHGTGVKIDGSLCWHMLSCSCPRCSPRCTLLV